LFAFLLNLSKLSSLKVYKASKKKQAMPIDNPAILIKAKNFRF
jgi:hypothetical protein